MRHWCWRCAYTSCRKGWLLGALLLGAGFSKLKAVQWVAVVEATTLLGGAVGLWAFHDVGLAWLLAVMAHVGGGFVYLAVHAVFGELLKHSKRAVLVNFLAGIALIGMLNVVIRFL